MSSYKIKVFPEALTDIQKATNWYNQLSYGLGTRFQKQVIKQIGKLVLRLTFTKFVILKLGVW